MNNPNTFCVTWIALLASAIPLTGCGDSAPQRNATVQGTLTIDGELASSGTVTFHPVDGGPVAVGQVHADGSYSLSTGRGTAEGPNSGTVFPGTYQVTVMVTGPQDEAIVVHEGGPPAGGPRLVAVKFTSVESSGLEFKIVPGLNLCVLPVLGAAHDPPVEEKLAEEETEEGEEESPAEEEEEANQEQRDGTAVEKEAADTPSISVEETSK